MSKPVRISLWITSLTLVLVLLGFVKKSRVEKECIGLQVRVDASNGMFFLQKEDIIEYLNNRKDTLVGKKMGEIDIHSLEEDLERIPEVKRAEVFRFIDGTVRVEIDQRRPLVRIFPESDVSFYLDEDGKRMPLSPNFTPRVLVVDGVDLNIDADSSGKRENELLDRIHRFAELVHNDPFWRGQIQQVHFNELNEVELIPRVGGHRVFMGELEGMEKKMRKLKAFYKEGLNHTGWNKYDTIDLKYEGQVVCKK